ncbi:unnamed protein product [Brassicogethes aeneus]|uniref:Uncharacterized protein n=1 Tax=Brassicogethes aeneus TaxID=1431903 RepID=A0A9P0AR13_BRAAE|nr:unnamed protein product [Brassicogethes aeneus]
MHQRAFLGGGWARGGASEVVRRAHPASGAQWNVQVVKGKVNGKCLWNACKALSLGLLLMVLGAAMATIGYYADDLSIAQEIRGNHTVKVKNESRGFHLNNLSYAGPIVMGVGGFIVVAACVMTFEARDSAAKVVPARFKLSTTGPPHHAPDVCTRGVGSFSAHNSLRTSGSQTAGVGTAHPHPHPHGHGHCPRTSDRRALTQSFMQFSRGLTANQTQANNMLKVPPQNSINKSPSAPDLVTEYARAANDQSPTSARRMTTANKQQIGGKSRRTLAACALLNPGMLHRHAVSVDEAASAGYRLSHESLHGASSQGSMAMDLHLECPVTLRIKDKRRNPLKRQRKVEEDEKNAAAMAAAAGLGSGEDSRRNSHSCSPRIHQFKEETNTGGGSAQQLPTQGFFVASSNRRNSNTSDCTHRSRTKRRDCPHSRGRLERAISSDSRLVGNRCHHHQKHSTEKEPVAGGCSSDTDIRKSHHAIVHFSPDTSRH